MLRRSIRLTTKSMQQTGKWLRLDSQVLETQAADIQHENEWLANNTWFNSNSAKAAYAKSIMNETNLSGVELTNLIESKIAEEFQPTNPNRERASVTDKAVPKQKQKGITYNEFSF